MNIGQFIKWYPMLMVRIGWLFIALGFLIVAGNCVYEATVLLLEADDVLLALFYAIPFFVAGSVFLIKRDDVQSHKTYYAVLIVFLSTLLLFAFGLLGIEIICSAGPSQRCGAAGIVPFILLLPLTVISGIVFLISRIQRLRSEQRSVTGTAVAAVGLIGAIAFYFYFVAG